MDFNNQIKKEIDKILQQMIKNIKNKSEKDIKEKIYNVVSFCNEVANKVLSQQMQIEFGKIYGTFYDEKSLINSFSIKNNGIRPEIFYDSNTIKNFYFNKEEMLDDLDEFNINASQDNVNLENIDFYFYNENYIDDGDISGKEIERINKKFNWEAFNYHNRINRAGGFTPVAEAFKIAKKNSLDYFNRVEMPKIRAYSKKKLGIDIY